jgi:glucose/arabinose dehydrogenase
LELEGVVTKPRELLLVLCVLTALGASPGSSTEPELNLVLLVANLDSPVIITNAGDGSGRLFIGEQDGIVLIWDGSQLLPQPFLDIRNRTNGSGERGLLGMAFHPDYETNDLFFVHYTDLGGDTVIAEYSASDANPNLADPNSERILLTVDQPFSNHNGGSIEFGPDGYLYIALGDGGSAGDPLDSGQDLESLLGKILRIDIDALGPSYSIPVDNPFVGVAGRDEIWAWGLRNPWRISFDRDTGDLFIGDVGQGAWEEIDFQPSSSTGGENYGWRCYEGNHPYNPNGCGDPDDYVGPILEHSHGSGACSITGGYRYRGSAFPNLEGYYVYADYCSPVIWGATQGDDDQWTTTALVQPSGIFASTFGEDENGELYVANHSGSVYRIIDESAHFADGFESGNTAQWSSTLP